MKIGAIIAVNCDRENVWFCLKGIYDFCDVIAVVYSDTTWVGEKYEDGTLDIIKGFEDPLGKLEIIEGTYTTQPGQRTAGLERLRAMDCDYAFVVDTDEVYDPLNLVKLQTFIEEHPEIYMFRVQWRMMWKTLGYELLPHGRGITVLYKITDEFWFPGPARQARYEHDQPVKEVFHINCFHLTCVCSNEYMKEKLSTRTYRDKVVPNWYEEKWLGWHPGMKNLHPTVPKVYKQAVPFDKTQLPGFMRSHKFWE